MKAAVILGSKSDFPVMQPCLEKLKEFGIEFEAHVISAHRSPAIAAQFAQEAKENGFGVIIAAAGKAAHLAGVLAGHSTLPVIGVPVKSSTMDGLDSLLSTVQMPSGVPVATVAINGAENAAILTAQIFALSDNALAEKLKLYKSKLTDGVKKADSELNEQIKELIK